jgi:hypothetical protein
MRDSKTVKKHMENQVAAQTSKSSYAARWQDLYTLAQAKQHCEDNDAESDEGGPGFEGVKLGGSTAEELQRPVKRRRTNDGEIPVVGLIMFNENIFFCSCSHCQYST